MPESTNTSPLPTSAANHLAEVTFTEHTIQPTSFLYGGEIMHPLQARWTFSLIAGCILSSHIYCLLPPPKTSLTQLIKPWVQPIDPKILDSLMHAPGYQQHQSHHFQVTVNYVLPASAFAAWQTAMEPIAHWGIDNWHIVLINQQLHLQGTYHAPY
jgi:hypothetical protein